MAQFRRQEARRARREARAAINSPDTTDPEIQDESAQRLQRHLDDAVAALPECDRQYLLVRFFERRKFAQLADRFGVSEDAAKKRVARAIDRLRSLLSAAALMRELSEIRVEALPSGLAASMVRWSKQSTPSGGSGIGLAELTEAAIGSWRWAGLRRWLVPSTSVAVAMTSLVVVLWAGPGWYRDWTRSRREPIDVASAHGPPALVAAMRERAEAARPRTIGASQIELSVVDATSGSPIPEARVLERRRGSPEGTPFGERIHSVDAQGVCRVPVEDRQFETLDLMVSAPGRAPAELSWASYEFNRESLSYRCVLHPGTVIVGEVRGPEERPVGGALVRWFASSPYDPGGRERSDTQMVATTDSAGRFAFEGVPVRWSQFGDPNDDEGLSSGVRTDRDGRFRLRPNPGAKLLRILHPDGFAIRPLAAGNDTVHRLEPWASVEGVLTENDQPVPGATIHLTPASTEADGTFAPKPPWVFELSTVSDAAGRFRFDRVPGGLFQAVSDNASAIARVRSGRSVSIALRR